MSERPSDRLSDAGTSGSELVMKKCRGRHGDVAVAETVLERRLRVLPLPAAPGGVRIRVLRRVSADTGYADDLTGVPLGGPFGGTDFVSADSPNADRLARCCLVARGVRRRWLKERALR